VSKVVEIGNDEIRTLQNLHPANTQNPIRDSTNTARDYTEISPCRFSKPGILNTFISLTNWRNPGLINTPKSCV